MTNPRDPAKLTVPKTVTVPRETWDAVDEFALRSGVSRSKAASALLDLALRKVREAEREGLERAEMAAA